MTRLSAPAQTGPTRVKREDIRRYTVLLVMLIVMSCAASTPTSTPVEPATLTRRPAGTPTATWLLSGVSDAKSVTATVASQQGQIHYVATNGHDSNPGTEAQPFRTIQAAANAAQDPGDTVLIRSGAYSSFRIRYSGAENQYITFKNYPGENPVITGGSHNILIQENTSESNPIGWIIIEGLEITNASLDGITAYNVHHLIIRNCDVHHSYNNNILITGSHHVTIDSNRLHENGHQWGEDRHHGHSIYATGNYYTVVNNLFYGGGAYGIHMAAYDQDVHDYIQPGFEHITHWIIANNTFAFHEDRSAIVVWDGYGGTCENIEIFNNIFYRNSESDVGMDAGTPNGIHTWRDSPNAIMREITIHHNLHFGEAPFIVNSGNAQYQAFDNMNYNPLFLYADIGDPGNSDFHLSSDSKAIDAGTGQDAPSYDFDGNLRPQGMGYDIGAYESPFSAQVTDLRVVAAIVDEPSLTITLRWTAPAAAVTYTLRSSNSWLTPANWNDAPIVTVPFTASEPGSSEWLTTPVDYTGGTLYLALKCQNAEGIWSALSNNAFWPHFDVYLPLTMKDYVSSSQSCYLTRMSLAVCVSSSQSSRLIHCLKELGQSQRGYAIMIKRYLYIGIGVIIVMSVVFAALFGRRTWNWLRGRFARPLPVSTEPIEADGTYANLIFLHHSTGHNLIAQGNVRALFTQKGYQFWDHDYNTIGLTRPDGTRTQTSYDIPEITPGVRGGGNTDPEGLAVLFAQPVHSPPDNAFSRLLQHEVLIFKSCFPNSAVKSDEMLEQNKTWYLGMRDVIDQHPDRIFISLTTPPLHPEATTPEDAARTRALANWLQSDEFLKGHPNLFVFDFFGLLADPETNTLRTEYQRDPNTTDSHPNVLANQAIGPLFVDFVDEAVQIYRANH